jgi:hypothetical protein
MCFWLFLEVFIDYLALYMQLKSADGGRSSGIEQEVIILDLCGFAGFSLIKYKWLLVL